MATILTADNFETALSPYGLPTDMGEQVREALASGSETAIEYRRTGEHNREPVHLIYFPEAGRGGVCAGGNTDWTDCDGLLDLEDRWEHYDERWCN